MITLTIHDITERPESGTQCLVYHSEKRIWVQMVYSGKDYGFKDQFGRRMQEPWYFTHWMKAPILSSI